MLRLSDKCWLKYRQVRICLLLPVIFSSTAVLAQQSAMQVVTSSNSTALQRVSLDIRDMGVEEALNLVAARARLKLSYAGFSISKDQKITIKAENMPLQDILSRILARSNAKAIISDGFIIISPRAPGQDTVSEKRSGIITGKVSDTSSGGSSSGVAGVTIVVAGTGHSTVSDNSGSFSISGVPVGTHRLTFRLLGYSGEDRSVEVKDKQRSVINVILKPSATALSGVVTTVTGEQRKLEIGNAITSIKVDSVLQVAPVSNLTELLEHRVPGLTVVRGSGQPGDPSRLRLRGASSINNSNDMIVVVDGVRVDANPTEFGATSVGAADSRYLASSTFDLIDPNSIETIDVFKGPSAAAMYGSDAANGVLVITTKRGRVGPTVMTATATRGISYMPGKYPEGTYAYGWFRNQTYGNIQYGRCIPADLSNPCEVDRIEHYQAVNDPDRTILGRGDMENYSLTVSGGVQAVQYSFTGSTSSEVGLIKMSNYLIERYSTRHPVEMPGWMSRPDRYNTLSGTGQISTQLKPNLMVRFSTGASSSTQRKTALGTSAIRTFIRMAEEETISDNQDRFYERMYRRNSSTTNTLQINWTIRERIRTAVTAGYNTTNSVDEAILPAGFTGSGVTEGYGAYSTGRQLNQQQTINANAEAPVWRDRIRVISGITYNGGKSETFGVGSKKVPEGVTRPSTFEDIASINSSDGSTYGWYVEPRLNLRSRFFVMPGFRLDNNGLSGPNAGAFLLPKLNTSWVMSDEDFFPWKEQVSLLRLRVAGGVAGTQPTISDRLRLVGIQTVAGQTYDALSFTSLGNTRLKPERSTEFEGGIDLDVWNGRAGIVYTFYNKMRYDAIERTPLAPSVALGTSSTAQNIGTIRNRGQEFEFRVTPVERLGFAWTTDGSISMNTNRVTRLRSGLLPIVKQDNASTENLRAGRLRVVEGYPLWGVWDRPLVGYADVDQNGVISSTEITLADSMVYLGQPDPKGTLSWSNNVRLLSGRLSFNAMMSYDWGMMQLASYMRANGSPFNTALYKLNPTLEEQALIRAAGQTGYSLAQTVSTVRLQSVSMNIAFPAHIAQMLRGRSLSLALQGSNLWMHSNYLGKDPNVGSPGLTNGATDDRGLIPQPRKWQLRFKWGN